MVPLLVAAHRHAESNGPSLWGTFPQWATAAIGLIAAIIAVNTYRGNAWQTKVKVARLVYCDVESAEPIDKGEETFSWMNQKFHGLFGDGGNFRTTNSNGTGPVIATQDLFAVLVHVTNNSEEPVGDVCLQIIRPNSTEAVDPDHPMWVRPLPPGKTRTYGIYVPRDWPPGESTAASVMVSFSDSAGQRWNRVQTHAPTKFKGKFG